MSIAGVIMIAVGALYVYGSIKDVNPLDIVKSTFNGSGVPASGSWGGTNTTITGAAGASNGVPGATGSGPVPDANSALQQKIISFCHAQIGKPYIWGAVGPNGFDCSGLIYAAYKTVGITIPRTTYAILANKQWQKVSCNALQPGDLVFPEAGHVFIAIGGDQMIEAAHTGTVIHQAKIYSCWTARRYVGSGSGGRKH